MLAEIKRHVAVRGPAMPPGDRRLLVKKRGIVGPNFHRAVSAAVDVGDGVRPGIGVGRSIERNARDIRGCDVGNVGWRTGSGEISKRAAVDPGGLSGTGIVGSQIHVKRAARGQGRRRLHRGNRGGRERFSVKLHVIESPSEHGQRGALRAGEVVLLATCRGVWRKELVGADRNSPGRGRGAVDVEHAGRAVEGDRDVRPQAGRQQCRRQRLIRAAIADGEFRMAGAIVRGEVQPLGGRRTEPQERLATRSSERLDPRGERKLAEVREAAVQAHILRRAVEHQKALAPGVRGHPPRRACGEAVRHAVLVENARIVRRGKIIRGIEAVRQGANPTVGYANIRHVPKSDAV